MVRFDLSDWEWANMLVGRNYRPDRLPKPVIDAEVRRVGPVRPPIPQQGTFGIDDRHREVVGPEIPPNKHVRPLPIAQIKSHHHQGPPSSEA